MVELDRAWMKQQKFPKPPPTWDSCDELCRAKQSAKISALHYHYSTFSASEILMFLITFFFFLGGVIILICFKLY